MALTNLTVDAEVLTAGSFSTGDGPIYLSDLDCEGSESSILMCPRLLIRPVGLLQSCDHSQDVGIRCTGY